MRSMLRHPLTWASVVAAAALALVMTFAYLGAFLDPVGNARDLPVALVSEDAGATVGQRRVDFGRQVVATLTAPGSPTGDAVDWRPLADRGTLKVLLSGADAALEHAPRDAPVMHRDIS